MRHPTRARCGEHEVRNSKYENQNGEGWDRRQREDDGKQRQKEDCHRGRRTERVAAAVCDGQALHDCDRSLYHGAELDLTV
ncbi:hypothetical protein RRG08_048394 [Elysia crispata]|uniref:Uncharacterized protein n=1 Tax=Elysia crispata TaxID=231223 RepID=A0AAE1BAU0_9GAST|nr:hypothetical protein RRG08_048394 [Elysia crispata]